MATQRKLRRSEDVKEDEALEVNPYVYMKYEEPEEQPTHFLALGTEFSLEYFEHLRDNPFYQGHRYVLNEKIKRDPDGYRFTVEDTQEFWPDFETDEVQQMKTQSLQQVQGLLNLPEYIKTRIIDLCLALNGEYPREEPTLASLNQVIHLENMFYYMSANSWTFGNYILFAPLIVPYGEDEPEYTLKFLRLTSTDIDFQIYPMIYSITVREGEWHYPVITPEGDTLNIYLQLGPKVSDFPQFLKFYAHPDEKQPTNETYYEDPDMAIDEDAEMCVSRRVDIPEDNPDDCVVIALFMIGMLPQPDMTRYHNLFRNVLVRERNLDRSIKHRLSYGYAAFVDSVLVNRVHSFYNRENPSQPLREIKTAILLLSVPGQYDKSETNRGITYGKMNVSPNNYFYDTLDQASVETVLNSLGCNRENMLFPINVRNHKLLLAYEGGKYRMWDPQVNLYYDDFFSHPNHLDENGDFSDDAYIGLSCVDTALAPEQFAMVVPEMLTLYEYYRRTPDFTGDPFPLIRKTIDRFSVQYTATRTIPEYQEVFGTRDIRDSFVFDLGLKHISLEELSRRMEDIELEGLGVIYLPNSDISFDYYNQLLNSLGRVKAVLTDTTAVDQLRQFASDYSHENTEKIEDLVVVDERQVYNFLMSRPLFSLFLREYTTFAADGWTRLSVSASQALQENANQLISDYLLAHSEPVLDTLDWFEKYFSSEKMVRFLRTNTYADLVRLVQRYQFQNAGQLQRVLEEYSQRLDEQLQREKQSLIRNRIAVSRVLLPQGRFITIEDVKRFFERHPDLIPGVKHEFSYYDPEVDTDTEEELALVLDEDALREEIFYRLTNQLSYSRQSIETRLDIRKPIQERIQEALSSRAQLLIDEKEEEIREMEKEFVRKRKKRAYRVPVKRKMLARSKMSEYLDIMIAETQSESMDPAEWTEQETRQLRDELADLSPATDEERDQAYEVFYTLIRILREQNKELDNRYLGTRKRA